MVERGQRTAAVIDRGARQQGSGGAAVFPVAVPRQLPVGGTRPSRKKRHTVTEDGGGGRGGGPFAHLPSTIARPTASAQRQSLRDALGAVLPKWEATVDVVAGAADTAAATISSTLHALAPLDGGGTACETVEAELRDLMADMEEAARAAAAGLRRFGQLGRQLCTVSEKALSAAHGRTRARNAERSALCRVLRISGIRHAVLGRLRPEVLWRLRRLCTAADAWVRSVLWSHPRFVLGLLPRTVAVPTRAKPLPQLLACCGHVLDLDLAWSGACCPVDDACLRSLPPRVWGRLQSLSLRGCRHQPYREAATPATAGHGGLSGAAVLAVLRGTVLMRLTQLDVSECSGLSVRTILPPLPDATPSLSRLSLRGLRCSLDAASGTEWDATTLRALSALPKLAHCDLGYCDGVGDRVLAALGLGRCAAQLEDLRVCGCTAVTDGGIAALVHPNQGADGGAKSITALDISRCHSVTDDGLGMLGRHCKQLRSLRLGGVSQVTDAGVGRVAQELPITQLDMPGLPLLTDAGLSAAAAAGRLTALDVSRCPRIGDEGLRHGLRLCASMRELRVSQCPAVRLQGLRSAAAAVELGTALRGLRVLSLGASHAFSEDIAALIATSAEGAGGSALVDVDLRQCARLSTRGDQPAAHALEVLAASAPALRSLRVDGCEGVSDEGLLALTGRTAGAGAARRGRGKGCAHLEVLGVSGCRALGDGSLVPLVRHCLQLRDLFAADTQLTDATLTALADSQCVAEESHLARLDVRRCGGVRSAGLQRIWTACARSLQLIAIIGCPAVDIGALSLPPWLDVLADEQSAWNGIESSVERDGVELLLNYTLC